MAIIEDINVIKAFVGDVKYHDADVTRIENMDINQGIARPEGPRHWECKADAYYSVYYTK